MTLSGEVGETLSNVSGYRNHRHRNLGRSDGGVHSQFVTRAIQRVYIETFVYTEGAAQ